MQQGLWQAGGTKEADGYRRRSERFTHSRRYRPERGPAVFSGRPLYIRSMLKCATRQPGPMLFG